MDHHQHVGRGFAHRDADPAHLLRQARLGHRDAVLHQHLRGVEIGAEREGDGDRELAVAGRLRGHVEHVLDAVDLLLDRRRDRVGDDLGGGAGIAGADLDRRRRDLGILRDRQREIGDARRSARSGSTGPSRRSAGRCRNARSAWPTPSVLRDVGSRLDRAGLRRHLAARPGAHEAVDDDLLVARQALAHDPQAARAATARAGSPSARPCRPPRPS